MLPNKELENMADDSDDDDVNDVNGYYGSAAKGKAVEMQPTPPPAQQVPFTPRTQAFHALERKLPLRTTYA